METVLSPRRPTLCPECGQPYTCSYGYPYRGLPMPPPDFTLHFGVNGDRTAYLHLGVAE